jgi:nucleotide-binding universal stress UspA family protein
MEADHTTDGGHHKRCAAMATQGGKGELCDCTAFSRPGGLSPYSEQALAYAIALATTLQARVTVVHVINHLPMAERYAVVSPRPNRVSAYLQGLEAEVRQRLKAQHKQLHEAGLEGEVLMRHGVPFQMIVDIARDQHARLRRSPS